MEFLKNKFVQFFIGAGAIYFGLGFFGVDLVWQVIAIAGLGLFLYKKD